MIAVLTDQIAQYLLFFVFFLMYYSWMDGSL